ncbi:lyase family protein [Thermospira aquatica]|uniref:argininosuccinate lyase n=1 Tax=Thermospira aquatica TaxID=2828656 RepID=A0AAX3BB92_9SPIR|nr:lyase family protein [Thermospira aquatica]URA09375.1 argininosuccinate lyase [Thermospira aquatica]
MAKVWEKGGENLHPLVESYEVGQDYLLDGKLYFYEMAASLAHAAMLYKIGILSEKEYQDIKQTIIELFHQHGKEIPLTIADEDIHSKLENQLTEKLQETGKKLHTGRSRNDQVMVVLRLYEKNHLLSTALKAINLLKTMANLGESHYQTILPGYTHTKQAMLMTVGFWMAGFIELGMDNLFHLENIYKLIDANPLGTGSGFGVPLPLDRDMTTRLLGFGRIHYSPLAVQNSRGKFEAMIVDALWNWMLDGSRLAADLLTWNMDELLFIETTGAITTGSSLMPQKRNLDVMELVRAKASVVQSYASQIKSMTTGLLSGYNRDMQETKEPLMRSFAIVEETLDILSLVLENIRFNEERIKSLLSPGLFATDLVFQAVRKGKPFRDAYREAAKQISKLEVTPDLIRQSLASRISPGSPLTYDYDAIRAEIRRAEGFWQKQSEDFQRTLDALFQ